LRPACRSAFSPTAGAPGLASFPEQADSHAKIGVPFHDNTMDIERVNAIGTLLADLSARTAALRGYL
jgi:hypothetical protein